MIDPANPPSAPDAQVPAAAVVAPAIVDSLGVVTASVPCRRCAYNLRSLSVAARCPECGAPVGVSVQGDLLRYGDPQWLQNLSAGANLVLWGICVNLFVTIVGGRIAAATIGEWIVPLFAIAGSFVQLYGAWLLTEPDPSGLGENRYGRARQTIRVALVVGLLGPFLQFYVGTANPSQEVRIAVTVAWTAAALVGVAGQFAMLHYLNRLAQRIPDEALARSARVVLWGYGSTMLVIILLTGAAALSVPFLSRGAQPAAPGALLNRGAPPLTGSGAAVIAGAAIGGCIAVIAAGVFGILFLHLLKRLSTAFANQAALARGLWADATPAGPAPA
jgi:hypothetical protein